VNAEQPPYSTMKKFHVMDADFAQETGELTPTMKVKRKFASQKYSAIIEKLYEGGKGGD
jgi:long-chain acyl-CoA synthetase